MADFLRPFVPFKIKKKAIVSLSAHPCISEPFEMFLHPYFSFLGSNSFTPVYCGVDLGVLTSPFTVAAQFGL